MPTFVSIASGKSEHRPRSVSSITQRHVADFVCAAVPTPGRSLYTVFGRSVASSLWLSASSTFVGDRDRRVSKKKKTVWSTDDWFHLISDAARFGLKFARISIDDDNACIGHRLIAAMCASRETVSLDGWPSFCSRSPLRTSEYKRRESRVIHESGKSCC
jgi:hypothetical protein